MNWIEKCDFLITRNLNWEKDTIVFEEDDNNSYELSLNAPTGVEQVSSFKKNGVRCIGVTLRILVANQNDQTRNGVWVLESYATYVSFFQEIVEAESFVFVDDMVFCFYDQNWNYSFEHATAMKKEQKVHPIPGHNKELLNEIEETIGLTMRDLVETTSRISKKARKKLIQSNDNQEIWDSLIDITFVQEEILSILKILIVKK